MNAFVSYSISDNELYIVTLLAQRLHENNITLTTSHNHYRYFDWQILNEIINSHFFIGLVAYGGSDPDRVYEHLKIARQYNKPSILLIEDVLAIPKEFANFPNIVRISRVFPHMAIEEVRKRIKASQTPGVIPQGNDAAAWILGGLAVLALIGLLSSDNKK